MLPPKFVSSCFHVSQDLHHCQSTPSFLARPKPKISLCSQNQTETRAMQASRFPRWSLTSTSTVNIYISPLFACVTNLENLKEHTFKNYQEHPIGVAVIIEWGGAIDLKNYADRKGCLETKLRFYIGGNIPLYRWYITCIFQISSAPAGYEEFAGGLSQSESNTIIK